MHDYMVEQLGCDHPVYEPGKDGFFELVWCDKCRAELARRQESGAPPYHRHIAAEYPHEDGLHWMEQGQIIELDELIAPIVVYLWKLGIDTDQSCQGSTDKLAYIGFVESQGPKRFLDSLKIEASADPESLYQRSANHLGKDRSKASRPYWEYKSLMVAPGRDGYGPDSYDLWVTVYFPSSDIQELTELIGQATD